MLVVVFVLCITLVNLVDRGDNGREAQDVTTSVDPDLVNVCASEMTTNERLINRERCKRIPR